MRLVMTVAIAGLMIGCAQDQVSSSPATTTSKVAPKPSAKPSANIGQSLMKKPPAINAASSQSNTKAALQQKRLQEIEAQERFDTSHPEQRKREINDAQFDSAHSRDRELFNTTIHTQ